VIVYPRIFSSPLSYDNLRCLLRTEMPKSPVAKFTEWHFEPHKYIDKRRRTPKPFSSEGTIRQIIIR
jgi:hypothetical protein